ncbi:MAG: prefoldin subunit alpha [Thermoplasmata archaeon]|nr:prefoldin subunit alpha [Thermoplasmata archaeon]
MTEDKDKELRELAASFEQNRAQLETIIRQEEMLRMSLEDYMRAKETMTRLKDCKDDSELLIPIGANNFVFARLGDKRKVIQSAGSDIAVEGTVDEAMERVESRITEISKARDQVGQKHAELESVVQQASIKLQKAYEEAQQRTTAKS